MKDFKSALLEMVKYQNQQLLKLQEKLEKFLIQNEQQLKLQERIEENQNKQLEFLNLTLKLFAVKIQQKTKSVFHKIPSEVQ